jgi:hypothetical protein
MWFGKHNAGVPRWVCTAVSENGTWKGKNLHLHLLQHVGIFRASYSSHGNVRRKAEEKITMVDVQRKTVQKCREHTVEWEICEDLRHC